MKAVLGALVLLSGLVLFVFTVDRSPWVLVAPVLVAMIVDQYKVPVPGLGEGAEQIVRELRAARR